jgi:hypothetical protein
MQNIIVNDREIKISRNTHFLILSILPIILLILAFLFDTPENIFSGINEIVWAPDILLTDYLAIGGFGAALLNVSLIVLINIIIIYKLNIKINGSIIAVIFTLTGFAFFGKTVFNIWPMYLGGILYAKYKKITFEKIVVVIMFSTCLAPVVSQLAFSADLPLHYGIIIGTLFGIAGGFIITPLSSNISKLHGGYNLYNVGFTAGLLGTLICSLMKSFGIDIRQQLILSSEYSNFFKNLLLIYFVLLIIFGYLINNKSFKGYGKIFKYSGKLVTDFTQLIGYGLTLINMGIMGLICMSFVHITSGDFNGPIIGGILTVVGFSAFGNHPGNSIPIMVGVFLGGILNIWDIQTTPIIIAGIFGTTLAPIAGKYGAYAGIFAGFLHLSMVMNIGIVHGGTNLYNNGFSGGLIASILVPVFECFKREE